MSAWICSDLHINAIATFAAGGHLAVNYRGKVIDCAKDPQHVASVLLAENYRSVNYRYGEINSAEIVYGEVVDLPSPVSMLKQLLCYDYQTCECPDYARTQAKAIVKACMNHVLTLLPGFTIDQLRATPQYQQAPWGLDPL